MRKTSKRLRSICYSDELWCNLFRKQDGHVTSEIKDVAKLIGWRTIFISSTLHLRRFKNNFEAIKLAI
ncbi:hypothetical protein QZH41_015911 [Actinostola sp. cb2023]|nr:hypothetical protein QZH41_015911 [Actinostola sp. cb2023]